MSKEHDEDLQPAAPYAAPTGKGEDSNTVKQLADRLFAAEQSTETEIKMSLWDALRLYPKASMWSILISFAVVMEGEWSSQRDQHIGHVGLSANTPTRLRLHSHRFFL
jgi:hypothetical protein